MKKLLFAFFFLLALANPVFADRYYCLLFAYDSQPVPIPCLSHVWGTFVHVDNGGKLVKEIAISWEPDQISYLDSQRPGWHSSNCLDFAVERKRSISMWGPFEIKKDFFNKAEAQYTKGGNYKFIDGFNRKNAQNCIHRLSDLAGFHRTGIYWGWWAGDSVCKHYRRRGVIQNCDGEPVMQLLGISKYSIIRR